MKTIALIAHDNMKEGIISWAKENIGLLKKFNLCGTGTTASLISKECGLAVKPYLSGPYGGDQQIGAKVCEGEIDAVIFFCDPLEAQPHDPDIRALLRVCTLYNVPIATNPSTAGYVLKGMSEY